MKLLIILGWVSGLVCLFVSIYNGLAMGPHLKEGAAITPARIPLFVKDCELDSEEGRIHRDRFHRWLAYFITFAALTMGGMYLHNGGK